MQSTLPNDDLGIDFLGTIKANGVPGHVQGGVWPGLSVGGFISSDNVETAYMGYIVSVDPTDENKFIVGWATGLVVVGPILNRQGIRENEPAKPDYILNEQPAEAVVKGPVWFGSWGHTQTGARTVPERGNIVVFAKADGHIEFMPNGHAIPKGYKPLLAAVMQVDLTSNGVEVNFEPQTYSEFPTEAET